MSVLNSLSFKLYNSCNLNRSIRNNKFFGTYQNIIFKQD